MIRLTQRSAVNGPNVQRHYGTFMVDPRLDNPHTPARLLPAIVRKVRLEQTDRYRPLRSRLS